MAGNVAAALIYLAYQLLINTFISEGASFYVGPTPTALRYRLPRVAGVVAVRARALAYSTWTDLSRCGGALSDAVCSQFPTETDPSVVDYSINENVHISDTGRIFRPTRSASHQLALKYMLSTINSARGDASNSQGAPT